MLKDIRIEKIAKSLLEYSVEIKKGERLLIRGYYQSKPLMLELIKQANKIGANAHAEILDDELSRMQSLGRTESEYKKMLEWQLEKGKDFDAFISIYGSNNDFETSDVPSDTKMMASKIMRPYQNMIVNEKRWVILNYPTYSLAQKAKMPFETFSDFVFDVSAIDYNKMKTAMQSLKKIMEKTDKVRIVSPGTDLTFSIKGIPAIPCAGENNIPDGEVFTAPVKNSVNGTIQYNTPSPYHGTIFNNVKLTFKDGEIVEATADNDVDKLKKVFETDEGAKYVGEFAIGVNPLIKHPMGNILYDEKIDGSIHFTPGQAYENEADNGNRSAIHWDIVLIQRKEYGGGEIYFDDVLVRKDGIFVIDELKSLNAENLM